MHNLQNYFFQNQRSSDVTDMLQNTLSELNLGNCCRTVELIFISMQKKAFLVALLTDNYPPA